MTKYYIQVADGLFGEPGHIYVGEENIVVPPGFTACSNEVVPVSYFVVFPSEMVREITEAQYDRIEKDEYGAIMLALESVGYEKQPEKPKENPRVEQAREKLANFKRAADELATVWQDMSFHEIELAGLSDNYPFELSFDDYEFYDWGEIPKRTPIEEAILFLDNPKYTEMYERNPDDLEVFKAIIKALAIRRNKAKTDEEEVEIDRLIENL